MIIRRLLQVKKVLIKDFRFLSSCYFNLRPLHKSVAKEKLGEILLIEAENEANNGLLASFPTKSSEISIIFTRHSTRAKVSIY